MKKITALFLIFIFASSAWPFRLLQAEDFNPRLVLSDYHFVEAAAMSVVDIQNFLEFKRSPLASYSTLDGLGLNRSAAEIISQVAAAYQISPKLLLVTLQKEQSLIEDDSPTAKQFDWAMGYGVCDDCDPDDLALIKFKGFAKQIDQAAKRLRWFFDHPGQYFGVNEESVVDNQTLVFGNAATAALYSYTPHIHGNYLFWQIWNRWFNQLYPDGSILQAYGQPGVWLIAKGVKRPFLNRGALISRYDPKKIIQVNAAEIAKYETGAPIKFANYSLLRLESGQIFLLVDDRLRLIASEAVFKNIGYNPEEVIAVEATDLAAYQEGETITETSVYPLGALLQDAATGGVYFVEDGFKYPIIAKEILELNYPHYSIQKSDAAELAEYQLGNPVKLKDGLLVKTKTAAEVYRVTAGSKQLIASESDFKKLGYRWTDIKLISQKTLDLLPLGETISLKFKE